MQGSEGEAMSQANRNDLAYGCIFCITGKEKQVAKGIERACKDVRTVVARQTKYITEKGQKSTVEAVLFPGYIFFMAPSELEVSRVFPKENITAIMGAKSGGWHLYGKDEQFAKWLFSYEGILPLSKAYQVGDRVHIQSGPLKDLEGYIVRVDKRNRSGLVALRFGDTWIKSWMGFEWVDE